MNEPQTLRELVRAAKERRGTSMRQLAGAAREQGFEIVDTTLNAMANGSYKARPKPDTIRAVAWLAGVDEEVAFAAARVPIPGPPFADELPPGVDDLSKKSRRAAIEVLRALVDAEQQGRAEAPPSVSLAAAREVGEPSAGERLRMAQDEDADVPDVDPGRP